MKAASKPGGFSDGESSRGREMSQATFPFASGPAFVHFWKPQPVIQGRGQSLTSEHQLSSLDCFRGRITTHGGSLGLQFAIYVLNRNVVYHGDAASTEGTTCPRAGDSYCAVALRHEAIRSHSFTIQRDHVLC